MRGKATLFITLSLGVAMNVSAGEDKKGNKLEVWYPPPLYAHRATETKEPGVYRMKLDNRTLEIALPEPEPDEFFMPEAMRTRGEGEEFEKALQKGKVFHCFSANWRYGLLNGLLTPFISDNDAGQIGAAVTVKEHAGTYVEAPGVVAPGYTVKGKKYVDLDYFQLEDFIRAVHSDTNTNPYWVETINGRRWVRQIILPQPGLAGEYREELATPLDRRRILKVGMGVSGYYPRYATPEDVPRWMQKANRNITAVLRSIKLSPPDDGSPDPFLIGPEQKAEDPPVEFPAKRR
jgi:hypothetical protein